MFKKLMLLFILPSLVNAEQLCQQRDNGITQGELQNEALVIGKIVMDVGDIFDTANKDENKSFHRYANNWHISTKQNIVFRELLFQQGDKYEVRLLEETERLLRAKPYIKAAKVIVTEVCDNRVTVKVSTKDNWTLTPGISFGRTGGKSKFTLELQEKNLFGLGKSLEFKYRKGLDRTQKSIKYNDDNLFGTHNRLDVIYEDNSDGKLQYFNYYRPFFSLDTPKSWGAIYFDNERITPLYQSGEIVDEIGQNRQYYSLSFGMLFKRSSQNLQRYSVGYTSDKSDFFNSQEYPDTLIPTERNYHYSWVGYEYFQEDYIEKNNFNSMGRQEDVSLGHHLDVQMGMDYTQSSIHYNLTYEKGFIKNDKNLFLVSSYFNGIYDNRSFINSHLGINLKWFHFQSSNKTFFTQIVLDKAENLFAENRQYLGGDTGLRGYPLRYLQGENKVLFTAEQRFFYDWYPLKTFQFASALFVDSGAAWNQDFNTNQVTNIGIGLRLVPTRTSSGRVIHIDFAFPIDDRKDVGSYQIQLRTKTSF